MLLFIVKCTWNDTVSFTVCFINKFIIINLLLYSTIVITILQSQTPLVVKLIPSGMHPALLQLNQATTTTQLTEEPYGQNP